MKKKEENMSTRFVAVTPALAKMMLEKNTRNRRLSNAWVRKLADDMSNGRWHKIGNDAITFDTDGNLTNGQHRLQAIIMSGTTQVFNVVQGVEMSANMDRPKMRSKLENIRLFTDLDELFVHNTIISTCSFLMELLGQNSHSLECLTDFIHEYEDELKEFFSSYQYWRSTPALGYKKNKRSGMLAAMFLAYLNGVSIEVLNNIGKAHITGEYVVDGDPEKYYPVLKLNNAIIKMGQEGSNARMELFLRTMYCIDCVLNDKHTSNRIATDIHYDMEYKGKHLKEEILNAEYIPGNVRKKMENNQKRNCLKTA